MSIQERLGDMMTLNCNVRQLSHHAVKQFSHFRQLKESDSLILPLSSLIAERLW